MCQFALGATIRRGLGPEPGSLHIHQAQGLASINLLRDMREGLVTFDSAGEPVPGQASDWEVSEDRRRYLFRLRPDARWSTGEQVTAGDFVRGWHRAFAPDSVAVTASLLGVVSNARRVLAGRANVETLGIRALAPDLLEISLEAPAPWIIEILTHPVSFPLHADAIDQPIEAPVNGAYLLSDWTPRSTIRLEKNPRYHSAASVPSDTVIYYPIEEPSAELARYRAGELDVTETIPAGRIEWLRENLGEDLRVHPYLGTFWLGFNFRHPALGKSGPLRKALSLAIDREILVGTVLGAGEVAAWSVVPPGMPGYRAATIEEASLTQDEREALARELLRDSGLARDDELLLELRYNTSGVHRRVAVAVAAMWKQVLGVNTELVNEEWKVFVNNRQLGVVTEVFRGGWIADYADPGSFLDLFRAGSDFNHTFYDSPGFDAVLKSAADAAGQQRMERLHLAEAHLLTDMPVIPLYYYVSRHLVRPAISGFVDNVRDIHLSRYLHTNREDP
jgi:oligopeptide transport system substrate-binding protein